VSLNQKINDVVQRIGEEFVTTKAYIDEAVAAIGSGGSGSTGPAGRPACATAANTYW
jgi:hypothetical protein